MAEQLRFRETVEAYEARSSKSLTITGDISRVVELGIKLQELASSYGIHNVFDDGGYKELILLTLFGLRKLSREGDDAEDTQGRRYEMKTVARVDARGRRKNSLAVTTEHTLTIANIHRYRRTHLWIIAIFDQSNLEGIYEVTPGQLEPYFARWESRLQAQEVLHQTGGAPPHLNNPKIPLWFVRKHGTQIWPPNADAELPPAIEDALEKAEHIEPICEP